jgi:hypothetical protein
MKNKISIIILTILISIIAGMVYAGAPAKPADEPVETTPEPKRKKAGEECKVSTECPRHHICEKIGEKNVCIVSPRPEVPPT